MGIVYQNIPMKYSLLSVFVLVCVQQGVTQDATRVSSPDGRIRFSLKLTKQAPLYTVTFNGADVIENSAIGFVFGDSSDGIFRENLGMGKAVVSKGTDSYSLLVGKASKVDDHYSQLSILLTQKKQPSRSVNFIVRVFNDGVAFRYEFVQKGVAVRIAAENTQFRFKGDPQVLALMLPNFTSSHEGEYTSTRLSQIAADTLMDLPTVYELPGKVFASITEANLVNYPGMYLRRHGGVLTSMFAPLPHDSTLIASSDEPLAKVTGHVLKTGESFNSPWRVVLLSERIGGLLESNIITSLNEDPKTSDWSWIRPGKTTFPWWNGNVVPDTLNAPGNNFVTNQYYIDFCARNNIQYHSIVEYGLHQWYVDDGVGFQPGPNADVTHAVPGLDMKEVCDYARSKGVGVRVWVHFYALYPKLDSAFAQFERWGLSGMMIDFMDRDDQEMVLMQEEMLQKAAAHHLHVQFHGAYKPTGLQRTYPNEFTREGTLNYEVNKWAKRITPSHDLNIAFARVIAGSTDYHLGGFRAVTDSAFHVQYTKPLMRGTRAHMLAMYVVLENYLGMVCDFPAAYEGQQGFEFIQQVPTTWDQTRVLNADLHHYLFVARRKGTDWFVGGINNEEPREISVAMDFLGEGNYEVTIFADGQNIGKDPNQVTKITRTVTNKDSIGVKLGWGGGVAMEIRKK